MSDSLSTFERLVLSLGSSERQEMLKQFAESGELKADADKFQIEPKDGTIQEIHYSEKQLKEEPLFVRIWFMVLSFLSSSTPSAVYAKHLVSQLGRDLDRSCGMYIDTTRRVYSENFYEEIQKLKRVQSFFSVLLSAYEKDKGGFYLVIGSLLVKSFVETITSVSDPFVYPINEEPTKDIRLSMTRSMDSAISSMLDSDRAKMYQAAGAIEWMKTFCNLPLDRIILRFGMIPGSNQSCIIDTVSNEMQSLVNALASAKKIPVLLLEALFLFSEQNRIGEEKFDLEGECKAFVDTSTAFLHDIRNFRNRLPLSDFVRFTENDVAWQPTISGEGEDWFVLFRTAWKRRFEERWVQWSRLNRKAMLDRNSCIFLGTAELPVLQYHPWDGLWMPLALIRETSLCFIKGLFFAVYPQSWMKSLKILLIDGDFCRRENLVEFTDAFSTLEHMKQLVETFEFRCSPKGDIGEGFALVQNERLATITAKTRIDNLMLTINSEAEQIISRSLTAMRIVNSVLGGVLGGVRGGQYETLLNYSTIQGKMNDRYRKELANVQRMIQTACAIIGEAEVVEKDSL